MPLLFAFALFHSAFLLFLVQPMVAKMVLPLLGGTPAVWTTSMLFFQTALLAGYLYAHVLTTWFRPRQQVIIHGLLLLVPAVVLPISVAGWQPPGESNPIPWLLAMLTVCVGLPFFVTASTAPLLQRWFAGTGHRSASDPYYLYAASNLGSMLALLGYPTLVEPNLTLRATTWVSQSGLWALGYGVLVLLILFCAHFAWRQSWPAGLEVNTSERSRANDLSPPDSQAELWKSRLHWIALAAVPSSLMLGVTTKITIDIASIPLLWVIPLAIYLLTFILVFARWPLTLHKIHVIVTPLAILLLLFMDMAEIKARITMLIALHLVVLYLVAMMCHGELARRRPPPRRLTEFYLLMSLGGVIGGIFNALVAPLIFTTVLELNVALVAACMLVPRVLAMEDFFLLGWLAEKTLGLRREKVFIPPVAILFDLVIAGCIGLIARGLANFLFQDALGATWVNVFPAGLAEGIRRFGERFFGEMKYLSTVLAYGIPTLLCYSCLTRPIRFGLAVAAVLLGGAHALEDANSKIVHQSRSFFGVMRVRYYPNWNDLGDAYDLSHGTTLHGEQIRGEEFETKPLTYYHETGPVGSLFRTFDKRFAGQKLAFIGLGTGTLSCYGKPGMDLTFFDIDPKVVYIARDSGYFTYLRNSKAAPRIILGDARLRLEKIPDGQYKLIVVDAFSSDSIPLHLISREAFQLYFRKLAPDGILAVHISNRYLDLEPVVGNIAADQSYAALRNYDDNESDAEPGKSAAEWVAVARGREHLAELEKDPAWKPLKTNPAVGVWTDDYSNLLSVFMWKN